MVTRGNASRDGAALTHNLRPLRAAVRVSLPSGIPLRISPKDRIRIASAAATQWRDPAEGAEQEPFIRSKAAPGYLLNEQQTASWHTPALALERGLRLR